MFAANTAWTRDFYHDILDAHMLGYVKGPRIGGQGISCNSNEQLCLNGLKGRKQVSEKILVTSGMKYNRGGCVLTNCWRGGGASNKEMGRLRMTDPEMEIMHWMGGTKGSADPALCNEGRDITSDGPDGY